MKQTVYVATYDYRYGVNIRVFTTNEAAVRWRDEIATEEWSNEFSDAPPTENIGETYFEAMSERMWGDGEYFRIDECEVEELYYVSIFLVDRAYGGPEEGGWYYETGEPIDEHRRTFETLHDANTYLHQLCETVLPDMNEDRPSISSVNSIGRYQALLSTQAPAPFPTTRPHYE